MTSLSTLKLSGTEDNSKEYVTFRPQGTTYKGYLSYIVPANLQPSSVTGASLQVNFNTIDEAQAERSMRLFAEAVIPRLAGGRVAA